MCIRDSHFVGLVVVGVEGFAGEDVVDLAVALVFVDAHGAVSYTHLDVYKRQESAES